MKSSEVVASQFKQAAGKPSSISSSKEQKDLTLQASKGERDTAQSRGSREEGGEDQLDQAAAYYDKIYFDSSDSDNEEKVRLPCRYTNRV